jgi:phosphoribosylformylglycinamidine cyclo-ligase
MPGLYRGNDYDLAGFRHGHRRRDAIIDGSDIRAGNSIIGLASLSPPMLLAVRKSALRTPAQRRSVHRGTGMHPRRRTAQTDQNLRPISFQCPQELSAERHVHNTGADSSTIFRGSCTRLQGGHPHDALAAAAIFGFWRKGHVPAAEMYRTFNMASADGCGRRGAGLGYLAIISMRLVKKAYVIGEIVHKDDNSEVVELVD